MLTDLHSEHSSDPLYTSLKTNIATFPDTHTDYLLQNDLILYKEKIMLSSTSPLRAMIITELHSTFHAVNIGIQRTLAWVQVAFYWSFIRREISDYI